MLRKALEDLATQFWEKVGQQPPFPRDLTAFIHGFTPAAIKLQSQPSIASIRRWLHRGGVAIPLDVPDRPLLGCLVAWGGRSFLFVDSDLTPHEQRVVLAHEFAHYLADYQHPRDQAQRRLGPTPLAIFDGERTASDAERIEATLAGIDVRPHVHFLERSADGGCSAVVNQVEESANELALELLAPWRIVQEELRSRRAGPEQLIQTLQDHYGLPAPWAVPYADRLSQHVRATRPFSETIMGEPATPATPVEASASDDRVIPGQELERALGQTVHEALNLKSWNENGGLEEFLARVPPYVQKTMREETRLRKAIRHGVLSQLASFADAPADAGVYRIDPRHLRSALRKHLLPGEVTAVNGACTSHDGLTATIVSIGVSLVCYDGQQRSWRTTFLRHDYGLASGNLVEEARALLDRRGRRSADGPGSSRDQLSYLLRRGFMAAAERRSLLEKAATRWRFGRGVPAPLELLTGSGCMALIDEVLPILDQLLLQHRHWLFLPSMASNLALVTLANALEPGQLTIIQKGKASLDAILAAGHFDTGYRKKVVEFATQLGEAMVIGGFRATEHAPGQLFAAHADHALTAGIIAMADATLQPHRGVPLLLDLAGLSAKVGLGVDAFQGVVESAYAQAGAHGYFSIDRFASERDAS